MGVKLEIPERVYAALEKAAEACGQTPADWIASRLPKEVEPSASENGTAPKRETLADLLAGRVGKFRSTGDGNWSEECGKKFADGMEEKRKAGQL